MKRSMLRGALFGALLAATGAALAIGTEFTWQGELRESSLPANGSYDFEFRLYAAATGGSPIGPVRSLQAQSISGGLYTALLDFGDQFTGEPRWLEISVRRSGQPEVWRSIESVDDGELWETHVALKSRLISFVRGLAARQAVRRGESAEIAFEMGRALSLDALTIGFARRFATYKRASLVFRDLERIAALVNDPQRPVQFVFAGKAHPRDDPGKHLLREVFEHGEAQDANVARGGLDHAGRQVES